MPTEPDPFGDISAGIQTSPDKGGEKIHYVLPYLPLDGSADSPADAYARMGTFYTTARACDELAMSQRELEQHVADGRILRPVTSDGAPVYPAFQFVDGKIDPNVASVVHQLTNGGMDPWSILHWLQVPDASLHGTAVDALLRGRDVDRVRSMAGDDLAHWIHVDEGRTA